MEEKKRNEETEISTGGNLSAAISDIRGGMYDVTISYDNGYAVKVCGELFPGAKFYASKRSIKTWEAPHEKEALTQEMVQKLIADVTAKNMPGTVHILFE